MKKLVFILVFLISILCQSYSQTVLRPGVTQVIFGNAGDTITSESTMNEYYWLQGNHNWIMKGHIKADYVSGTPKYIFYVRESLTPLDTGSWVASTVPNEEHTTAVDTFWMWTDTVMAGGAVQLRFNANNTTQKVIISGRIRGSYLKE